MKLRSMLFPVALVLCIGLAIAPVAAAQKGPAPAGDKVNLNSATAEQLETLPGIGPSIAKSILEYRSKVGKFTKIEEILNVKGVGEKKFQRIKDRLTV
jgi:competence protein ComEA